MHGTLLRGPYALKEKLLITAGLLVETHLKPGHADVNLGRLEALKHIRKGNLDCKESYC